MVIGLIHSYLHKWTRTRSILGDEHLCYVRIVLSSQTIYLINICLVNNRWWFFLLWGITVSLAPFYTLFQILVTKVTIAMVVTCNIISDLWNKQFRVATYRAKYAPTVLCNQISLLGDKKNKSFNGYCQSNENSIFCSHAVVSTQSKAFHTKYTSCLHDGSL